MAEHLDRLGEAGSLGTCTEDDYEPGITAAREFGLPVILFRETGQAIMEIRALLQGAA